MADPGPEPTRMASADGQLRALNARRLHSALEARRPACEATVAGVAWVASDWVASEKPVDVPLRAI